MAAATSSAPPTVMPCSRAVWPARWMTGPSASGSENGTPISSAAIPEPASLFPTAIDFLRLGWPAIRYPISFRSSWARTESSSREVAERARRARPWLATIDRIHVLVAAPRQADQDPSAGAKVAGDEARLVESVGRLERRHDPLEPRAELERGQRILVRDGDVVDALDVPQVAV